MNIKLSMQCPHQRFKDEYIKSSCIPGYVYLAKVGDLYKIGFTRNRKIHYRMTSVTYERKTRAIPLLAFQSFCAKSLESELHLIFRNQRAINRIDQTDYFRLLPEQVDAICALETYAGAVLEKIQPRQYVTPYERNSGALRKRFKASKLLHSSPSMPYRALVVRGECGHRLIIPTKRSRIGVFDQALIFSVTEMRGVYCQQCNQTVRPVKVLATEALPLK